ncbi:MAG TPA: hypothetical protein VLA83_01380 [Candidatus Binatia bacterium]|nr:hypothetical protein [Candidatus Binatia bacterium]
MTDNKHLQSREGGALPPGSETTNHKTQPQHILDLLMAAEGAEVPLADIMICAAQYNTCIHELRKRGYNIVNRAETRNGVKHSWYRLESSPVDLTPRTPGPEPAPSRQKSGCAEPAPSRSETTRTPHSSAPAQALSLFPEMPAPAASPQRYVWRDPELNGLKNDGVKKGSVKHG